MEMRQLKYFVGVAEAGSFTRAAGILDIAQPALSRQIRELEAELGVALLIRNGRGAVLTDAGVKFLSRAKMILDDSDRALQEARALKGRPMGLVSIGMPPAIGTILSVPTFVRVRQLYPEIQLQLTDGYSGHIHEWLLSGRIDIGVFYHPLQRRSDQDFHKLATEQLCLLGAPKVVERHLGSSTGVAFDELLKLPLMLPARPHAIRRLVDEVAARKNVEVNLATEVNAYLAVRDLIVQGHGVTVLPVSSVLPELNDGRLKAINIKDPVLSQTVNLMTSTHHMPSLATTTVTRVIRDLAQELVNTAAWPLRNDAFVAGKRRAAR